MRLNQNKRYPKHKNKNTPARSIEEKLKFYDPDAVPMKIPVTEEMANKFMPQTDTPMSGKIYLLTIVSKQNLENRDIFRSLTEEKILQSLKKPISLTAQGIDFLISAWKVSPNTVRLYAVDELPKQDKFYHKYNHHLVKITQPIPDDVPVPSNDYFSPTEIARIMKMVKRTRYALPLKLIICGKKYLVDNKLNQDGKMLIIKRKNQEVATISFK